jgi:hypothetical protein
MEEPQPNPPPTLSECSKANALGSFLSTFIIVPMVASPPRGANKSQLYVPDSFIHSVFDFLPVAEHNKLSFQNWDFNPIH